MHKLFQLLLLVFFISLTSCELDSRNTRLWFYTHSSYDAEPSFKPSHFIYLKNDGTYTSDLGLFEYGTWEKAGEQLFLTNHTRSITTLPILKESSKELQVKLRGEIAFFASQPTDFYGKQDPFSLENNKWRIPAAAPESREEIKERLINHCKFWETYFTWGDDNNLTTLDVRSTPTPIKIYGNGVGLKKYNELPKAWRSYFYDSTDCFKATDMLRDVFRKNEIAWPTTDNKYRVFLSAFQQVRAQLKDFDVAD